MDQEPINEPAETIEDAGSAMADLMKPTEDKPPGETPPPPKDAPPPKDETPPAPKDETPPGDTPPPGDEKPPVAEEPPPPPPEEDKFGEEIEQISPKSKEAIGILKRKALAEHQVARDATKKLTEVERERAAEQARIKELEGKTITPEIENEINELRTFKQTYALETDPEVTKPFDERVANASTTINDVLKQVATPEATMKFIEQNGGLYKFRMSNGLMPKNLKNKDGSAMTHAQFYKNYIAANISEAQQEELNDSFAEIRRAERDKAKAIQHLSTNKEEFLKKRNESVAKAREEWVKRVGDHSQKVLASYGDAAKLKEVPPNATPEQVAEIEKHNQTYRTAEAKAQQILSNVTPENLVEAAIAAGYVTVMQSELKSTKATLDAVTKERDEAKTKLAELINSGKTTDLTPTEHSVTGKITAKNAEDAMVQLMEVGK